ncbi:MATE family efflux transporter [Bradyrhizobium jicamae]|uniref:MATE family efflux transporter n=1 Tax=Bradyrhizobium jicamae TaxID=280332 RepID=A0ABS5FT20_9BRAD|nr:MATE family efflux transporter [Bradyrhizobium jicamae]MBR0799956.1 MATE family efflux transporter [Bradyrhizobium jicamae]
MTDPSIADPPTPYSPRPVAKPAPVAARPAAARTKLLLEGPIFATLLRLAAPNILNLIAFVAVITFDGFFLGKIGTDALAGASLAFPWIMLVLQTTNSGMGAGVSSAVARALGAGHRERADELTFHAFLLALALGATFSTVMPLAAPFLFGWMGGRDKMLIDALLYANAAFGGAVCITVLNLLGNAVRGTGNMSLHAGVLVACVIAHIALAPALMFGYGPLPAMGPAGAGWGLVIPFGVGSLVMIGYLRSSRSIVRLNFVGATPRWAMFADILKVGVPGLINTAITNLSVVVLTGIAGQFGPEAAIGYAMGSRLEYIMQPIAFGIGTAIVAMVGTNWGARQYDRARRIAWTGAITIALVCGTLGLIVAVRPGLWLGLFSDDAEVARLGTSYLRIVGPVYVCFGLGLGLFFVCQGYGRGFAAMTANAVRLFVSAGAGLAAVYWFKLGVTGLFIAIAAGFCVYAALTALAVLRVSPPSDSPAA